MENHEARRASPALIAGSAGAGKGERRRPSTDRETTWRASPPGFRWRARSPWWPGRRGGWSLRPRPTCPDEARDSLTEP